MELTGIYDCDIHLLNYLSLENKLSLMCVNKYCHLLIRENLESFFSAVEDQPNLDPKLYKDVCYIIFVPPDRYAKCNLFYKICLSGQINYVQCIFEKYKKDILCYRGFINYIFKKMCQLNYMDICVFLLKYTNISYEVLKECVKINKTLAFMIQCTIKSKLGMKQYVNCYDDLRYVYNNYKKCEYCYYISNKLWTHFDPYKFAEKNNLECCCEFENLHEQWFDIILPNQDLQEKILCSIY
jgi:hypothetical protein